MGKTVEGMESAFKSMDAAKISKIMDDFETAFTEADLKTSVTR
jgi:hypothetical protein